MKTVQREGTTTEQIINDFLKEYNLKKEEVNYTIIESGSKGFLSIFGKKPAIVKFEIPEEKEVAIRFLENLLKKMDATFQSVDCKQKDSIYYLTIKENANPGFLIGKEGRMLNSIEHLLNRLLENNKREQNKVVLNVNTYREDREELLLQKVKQVVRKVQERKTSITLEPMNSADRKIVHKYLEEDKDVKTMSIGKGELKRIVLYPITDEPQKSNNRPRTDVARTQRITRKRNTKPRQQDDNATKEPKENRPKRYYRRPRAQKKSE